MKYVDGLNYLDQLKEYVQTSLSIRQNVQLTPLAHKVEQVEEKNEDVDQIEDPFSMNGNNFDENMDTVDPSEEESLIDIVKEEISFGGKIY